FVVNVRRTSLGISLADSPAEEVEPVLSGNLADTEIVIAAADEAANDIRAIGGRLQTVKIRRWQAVGRVATPQDAVETDMVTYLRVGANPEMSGPHQLAG